MICGKYKTMAAAAMLMALIAAPPASDAQRRGNTGPVVVKRIDVIHGRDGVEIEITASASMKLSSKRLSNPERFVVDLQDSVPDPLFTADRRLIPVNEGDIRSVRISPYLRPGEVTTRLVVDLATRSDIQLTSAGAKVRLKVRSAQVAQAAVSVTAPQPAAPREIASKPAPVVAAVPAQVSVPVPAPVATDGITANGTAEHAGTPEQGRQISGITPAIAVEMPVPVIADLGTHSVPRNLLEAEFVTAPPAAEPAVANRDTTDVARAETAEPALPVVQPATPPASIGVGVTGKRKDKKLGMDQEEAAIKATIATNKNVLVSAETEARRPVGLRLSGTATAGYYQASTTNGYASREASPVGSMRLDASGYLHSPGFFNYSVRPQASTGRQSSEGVFPDGQGVSGTATFLGGGVAPLTVSYNRLNRKLVTFGPLERLAGLEANTFQDSLGANWRLMFKHFPEIGLNFSKYSDTYEPLAALAPKTSNAGRLLAGDITQKFLGWNLQSRYKMERSSQELINIFDPSQEPYLYNRKDQEARASADRELGRWGSASFVAGQTKSQNEVQGRPFDQSFRFLTGNTFLRAGKRLTLIARAGVTDNVVGATLEQTLGSDGFAPPQPFLLLPSKAKLQMMNYAGSAQYAFTNDLRIQADFVREMTRTAQSSTIIGANSELTSGQAGIAFNRRFRWWQLQAYYAANLGQVSYAATGLSRSLGHRANLGASFGSLQSLELSFGVHGSLQNVRGGAYMYDRSAGANVTLSRSFFEHWKLRLAFDRDRNQYEFSGEQYSAMGNAGSLALIHPKVELYLAHNIRDGMTFQADPRLQYVSAGQSGLLLGAYPGTLIVPTGATWSNATLSIHPVGKLTGRVTYMRSRQRLQGTVSNYYEEWDASAGYQFRSITLDAGYVLHDQNFVVDMFKRNRFYFRVVREFTAF